MTIGQVVIDSHRCKGCGLCTHICPSNILVLLHESFNNKGYHPISVSHPNKCIGCGVCAVICPDVVFTVYRMSRQVNKRQPVVTGG